MIPLAYAEKRERSRPPTTDQALTTPAGSPDLRVAGALASAARELLRAGLGEDARPLVERLCDVLDAADGAGAVVIDLAAARAGR